MVAAVLGMIDHQYLLTYHRKKTPDYALGWAAGINS
jgi:hypothetical protein